LETLQLRSVTKKYATVTALDNVSLDVEEGDFIALLGPNGAGKTSIIRILMNFTEPTSGEAFINGISCKEPQARAQVGYLPENVKIPTFLTGLQYLERHAELNGMVKSKSKIEIDKVLEIVGMSDRKKHRTGTYSKGMYQRIGLAAALLNSPKILILDEPVNGLDPIGIREFRLILERLKADKITLLLNSHILSEVERLCNTAVIINKGIVVVKDRITNLVRDGESLEDVFIRAVGK
jgi:ABC-2 type transport system ATP-binding protein